jgi:hypothetical protein
VGDDPRSGRVRRDVGAGAYGGLAVDERRLGPREERRVGRAVARRLQHRERLGGGHGVGDVVVEETTEQRAAGEACDEDAGADDGGGASRAVGARLPGHPKHSDAL